MKHFGKRFLCGILTVCMLSSLLCTFAFARSSAYLNSYRATVVLEGSGEISVLIDVSGRGTMTKIGATEIYIYESADDVEFTQVEKYKYENYPEMMKSNTNTYYDAPVTYQGRPGYYYKASVYCYAENANGSDEKNYTTASKQA